MKYRSYKLEIVIGSIYRTIRDKIEKRWNGVELIMVDLSTSIIYSNYLFISTCTKLKGAKGAFYAPFSAAGSWQMINRTETMMNDQFDFGFAVDWMRKDLAICFEEAERLQIKLPLAQLVDQEYKKLQANGHGRSDTSVLIKQFEN